MTNIPKLLLCSIALWIVPFANAFTDLGGGAFQSDGSKDDTQAAANAAPVGGTVLLPSGSFTWTGTCFVDKNLNISGAPGQTTIVNNHTPNPSFEEKGVFKFQGKSGGNVEVKNIHFAVASSNTGPYTGICQLWYFSGGGVLLLHDCTLDTTSTVAKGLRIYSNRALIWNCTFNGSHRGYEDGIAIQDNADTYPQVSTMGTLDKTGTANCYVEDTKFNNVSPGYALDVSDSARVVVRHCIFSNSYIGSHGQESGPYGMRHAEVYDCNFSVTPDDSQTQGAIWMRGGSWAIFNNTFATLPGKNQIMMQVLSLTRGISYIGGVKVCPTHYPIPRQIGQGWIGAGGYSYPDLPQNGDGYTTEPVYVWDNNPATPSVGFGDDVDSCGNGLKSYQFVKSGRDYFIGTAKPGYTPYPYPHPLRTGGPGPTPTPPQPTPTPPQPTPTPSPSPSATPPPAATFENWIQQQNNWIRSHPPTPD